MKIDLSVHALLGLLQWSDSLFPVGGYAYSFALEEAVRDGTVKDAEGLFQWIQSRLIYSVFPGEMAILRSAYAGALQHDLKVLSAWDGEGVAMRIPKEFREGSTAIGKRWIHLAAELYPSPWTSECLQALKKGDLQGDPAVAAALVGVAAERPLEFILTAYLYGAASGQVSAGLRLLPMGQRQGQQILCRLWRELSEEEMLSEAMSPKTGQGVYYSSFLPAQEIRGMLHETARVRLFQS